MAGSTVAESEIQVYGKKKLTGAKFVGVERKGTSWGERRERMLCPIEMPAIGDIIQLFFNENFSRESNWLGLEKTEQHTVLKPATDSTFEGVIKCYEVVGYTDGTNYLNGRNKVHLRCVYPDNCRWQERYEMTNQIQYGHLVCKYVDLEEIKSEAFSSENLTALKPALEPAAEENVTIGLDEFARKLWGF